MDDKTIEVSSQIHTEDGGETTAYSLLNIPKELWRSAKRYCIDNNLTLRDAILSSLEERLTKEGYYGNQNRG